MKKGNKLRDLATKVLGLALAFCMAVTFCAPMHVEAKKIKTLKLNPYDMPSNVEHVESVATTVKRGTYKIKIKTRKDSTMCAGWVKFTAPKTKTYAITLSELSSHDKFGSCGHADFNSPDSNNEYTNPRYDVKVKGDTASILRVHSQKKPSAGFRYKRTGKIHLNEGEVIYIHFQFTGERPTKYVTAKLKIK